MKYDNLMTFKRGNTFKLIHFKLGESNIYYLLLPFQCRKLIIHIISFFPGPRGQGFIMVAAINTTYLNPFTPRL